MKLMPKITSTVLATITGVVAVAQTGPISENVSQPGPTVQSCAVVEDICPKIQTAVDWASKVANDDTIGYSLGGARTGEYDCSKLVITSFEVAGIWTGATYTGNMYDTFTRNGFTAMKYQYGMDLEVGDVLLTKGHTEMYIGNGTNVGAHLDFDGKRGDSSGDEIDFGPVNEYTKNWTWVLRYAPHWYEWYTTYISEEDSFYAFVEHNDKVLSYRDGTISVERETGEEHQIWRFEKKGNNYRITNGAFEGDFCIYQTSSDSLILHEANTDNSCLTNLEGIVKLSPYDACESKQRFEIRPLTSVRVEYDFGGNSCPIFEENYGENYLGAYDLTWMSGFIGWFDEKGNKIDASSKVTNPHAHTLTARFDEEIEPTVTIETVPESTTVISVTNPQYNAPLELESTTTATTANRTTTAKTTNTTVTTSKKLEIKAESISLNRTDIMLNTAGQSKTLQLRSTINPMNVTDTYVSWSSSNPSVAAVDAGLVVAKSDGTATITAKTKNGKTAICTVTVKTSYDKIKGEWTEYTTTPIYESSTIEVETKNVVEKVLWGYTTDSYSTRTWSKLRQYRNFSIDPAEYGLDTGYGENYMSAPWMFNNFLTFSKEEFSNFRVIHPDEWSTGSQSGQNKASVDGYEYYDGYIIFIKEKIYNDITTTYYRSRTITEVPTVYVN